MQGRCRGTPDEEGSVHSSCRHFPAEFFHLIEGRSDESAGGNDVGMLPDGCVQYRVPVHHDAEVNDIESVASEYSGCYVLADVVDISAYGGYDNLRPGYFRPVHAGVCPAVVRGIGITVHVRLQVVHCILHDFCRLDDLRQEHLAVPEKFPDFFHSDHKRALYDACRRAADFKAFFKVLAQRVSPSRDEGFGKPFPGFFSPVGRALSVLAVMWGFSFHPAITSGFLFLCLFSGCGCCYVCGLFNQPFGCSAVRVEDDIFHAFQKSRLDVVINLEHSRIDYGHVKSCPDCMVKEGRVHRLADSVVASEGK